MNSSADTKLSAISAGIAAGFNVSFALFQCQEAFATIFVTDAATPAFFLVYYYSHSSIAPCTQICTKKESNGFFQAFLPANATTETEFVINFSLTFQEDESGLRAGGNTGIAAGAFGFIDFDRQFSLLN
jgi:hypothetical protein